MATRLEIDRVVEDGLEGLLGQARELTRAEAGTIYLREGDQLRFAVVQNDCWTRRVGPAHVKRCVGVGELNLEVPSIAGYSLLARSLVNIADAYDIPLDRPYRFLTQIDLHTGYHTISMLALPLRDRRGWAFGVLQLINARNAAGEVVPFDRDAETAIGQLVARVAATSSMVSRASDAARSCRPAEDFLAWAGVR